MERYEVLTDLSSWADQPYEDLTVEERAWWDDMCDRYHAADVEYEQLSPEEQQQVYELLADVDQDRELKNYVEAYEQAVAEVTGS